MKRNLKYTMIFLLITVLIFSLSGCGNNEKNTSNQTSKETVENKLEEEIDIDSDKLFALYAKAMGKSYYMKYETDSIADDGTTKKVVIEVTREGERYGVKAEDAGIDIVIEEGKVYIVVHPSETIMIQDLEGEGIEKILNEYKLSGSMLKLESEYISSGTKTIDGEEMSYEEYISNNEIVKYFFLGDALRYIEYEDRIMKIMQFTIYSNEELFKVPLTYSIMNL